MEKPKERDYGLVDGSNYNKIDLYRYTRELQKYCEHLEQKVKELPISDVVGRSEQLIDFMNFMILDGQLDLEPDEVKGYAEIFLGD